MRKLSNEKRRCLAFRCRRQRFYKRDGERTSQRKTHCRFSRRRQWQRRILHCFRQVLSTALYTTPTTKQIDGKIMQQPPYRKTFLQCFLTKNAIDFI